MNTGLGSHISEELLEKYALGKLVDPDCAFLEEHLLTCLRCQINLEIIDDYIRVFRAAAPVLLVPHKLPSSRCSSPSSAERTAAVRNQARGCIGRRAKIQRSHHAASGIRGNTDRSHIRMA